jgi:hypothetical protein
VRIAGPCEPRTLAVISSWCGALRRLNIFVPGMSFPLRLASSHRTAAEARGYLRRAHPKQTAISKM